jgi:hypothetical protein
MRGRPLLLLLPLLVAAAAAPSGGGPCSSSLDCWLNGDCLSRTCACDAAWDGPNCEVLAEEPSVQLYPPPVPPTLPPQELASSWGPSLFEDDDGIWHMYVDVVCSNFTWMHMNGAVIAHAVSSTGLLGPYTFSSLALPQQSFTPHLTRVPEWARRGNPDLYVLANERCGPVSPPVPQCTGSYGSGGGAASADLLSAATEYVVPSSSAPSLKGPPSFALSTSPWGPFSTYRDVALPAPPEGWNLGNSNPSLLFLDAPPGAPDPAFPLLANFSALVAYTAVAPWSPYQSRISVAGAAEWDTDAEWTPLPAGGLLAINVSAEDPFIWRDARGLHVVFHRMADNATWIPGSGGLAVSADGINWRLCPTPVYTTTVTLANGTVVDFARRERPEMVFDKRTGELLGISNGFELITDVLGRPSLSLFTPVRTGSGS